MEALAVWEQHFNQTENLLILTQSEAIKRNQTAQVVIRHIIRESEYFIGIVDALLSKQLL